MRRGYSVTELLVVIAIIAVMAALLFPAVAGAKKATNKVVCASNMHQIYLAAKLYENDNGGLPKTLYEPAFKPYYPTILTCPSSKNAAFPNLRKADYTYVGVAWRREGKAMDACRAARGPMLPLVFDGNHAPSHLDRSDVASKILVVRDSGAFDAVPAAQAYLSTSPCDPAQVPVWYNF